MVAAYQTIFINGIISMTEDDGPPQYGDNHYYRLFMETVKTEKFPVWYGIDWGIDSGMNRGDIIKTDGNVVYLRFKAVTYEP